MTHSSQSRLRDAVGAAAFSLPAGAACAIVTVAPGIGALLGAGVLLGGAGAAVLGYALARAGEPPSQTIPVALAAPFIAAAGTLVLLGIGIAFGVPLLGAPMLLGYPAVWALLTWGPTRSRAAALAPLGIVAGVLALMTADAVLSLVLHGSARSHPAFIPAIVIAWQFSMAWTLLRWSSRKRDERLSVYACIECGYPRTGLSTTAPCPECGAAPQVVTA